MNATLHPLALEYLLRVEDALAPLAGERRQEVLDDLHEHLEATLAGASTEADVLNALDRLGDPRDVADAALAESGIDPAKQGTVKEWVALALILLGGATIVLWVVGVALAWESRVWQRHHKLLATFLPPFGVFGAVAIPAFIFGTTDSSLLQALHVVVTLTFMAMPLCMTLVLIRALGRYREAVGANRGDR